MLNAAESHLNPMLRQDGFSAYQMVFGSDPPDLNVWHDGDSNMDFAQDASVSGQFAHHWQFWPEAQRGILEEIAKSKLRR